MSQIRLAAEAVEDIKVAQGKIKPRPKADGALVAQTAIDALVRYIPTEVVTLYIACVSALPAVNTDFPILTGKVVFWAFVVINPVLFLLIYYNQLAVNDEDFPRFWDWPWWRLFASTAAFCVWALAVPNNPFIGSNTAGVLSGIAAAFVSTLLSLIGLIVERKPRPQLEKAQLEKTELEKTELEKAQLEKAQLGKGGADTDRTDP